MLIQKYLLGGNNQGKIEEAILLEWDRIINIEAKNGDHLMQNNYYKWFNLYLSGRVKRLNNRVWCINKGSRNFKPVTNFWEKEYYTRLYLIYKIPIGYKKNNNTKPAEQVAKPKPKPKPQRKPNPKPLVTPKRQTTLTPTTPTYETPTYETSTYETPTYLENLNDFQPIYHYYTEEDDILSLYRDYIQQKQQEENLDYKINGPIKTFNSDYLERTNVRNYEDLIKYLSTNLDPDFTNSFINMVYSGIEEGALKPYNSIYNNVWEYVRDNKDDIERYAKIKGTYGSGWFGTNGDYQDLTNTMNSKSSRKPQQIEEDEFSYDYDPDKASVDYPISDKLYTGFSPNYFKRKGINDYESLIRNGRYNQELAEALDGVAISLKDDYGNPLYTGDIKNWNQLESFLLDPNVLKKVEKLLGIKGTYRSGYLRSGDLYDLSRNLNKKAKEFNNYKISLETEVEVEEEEEEPFIPEPDRSRWFSQFKKKGGILYFLKGKKFFQPYIDRYRNTVNVNKPNKVDIEIDNNRPKLERYREGILLEKRLFKKTKDNKNKFPKYTNNMNQGEILKGQRGTAFKYVDPFVPFPRSLGYTGYTIKLLQSRPKFLRKPSNSLITIQKPGNDRNKEYLPKVINQETVRETTHNKPFTPTFFKRNTQSFQQGGQLTEELKKEKEEFAKFLVEKSGAKTQKELEDFIKQLGEEGIEKLYLEFKNKKKQKALHGAKLNYIERLKFQKGGNTRNIFDVPNIFEKKFKPKRQPGGWPPPETTTDKMFRLQRESLEKKKKEEEERKRKENENLRKQITDPKGSMGIRSAQEGNKLVKYVKCGKKIIKKGGKCGCKK